MRLFAVAFGFGERFFGFGMLYALPGFCDFPAIYRLRRKKNQNFSVFVVPVDTTGAPAEMDAEVNTIFPRAAAVEMPFDGRRSGNVDEAKEITDARFAAVSIAIMTPYHA